MILLADNQDITRAGLRFLIEGKSSVTTLQCSDKAGFITGENICIDGGMTKQMIYHGDNGWSLDVE